MPVFVHAQGIKIFHAGGEGVKKWQNSVHVVVECPLMLMQSQCRCHYSPNREFINDSFSLMYGIFVLSSHKNEVLLVF